MQKLHDTQFMRTWCYLKCSKVLDITVIRTWHAFTETIQSNKIGLEDACKDLPCPRAELLLLTVPEDASETGPVTRILQSLHIILLHYPYHWKVSS